MDANLQLSLAQTLSQRSDSLSYQLCTVFRVITGHCIFQVHSCTLGIYSGFFQDIACCLWCIRALTAVDYFFVVRLALLSITQRLISKTILLKGTIIFW